MAHPAIILSSTPCASVFSLTRRCGHEHDPFSTQSRQIHGYISQTLNEVRSLLLSNVCLDTKCEDCLVHAFAPSRLPAFSFSSSFFFLISYSLYMLIYFEPKQTSWLDKHNGKTDKSSDKAGNLRVHI